MSERQQQDPEAADLQDAEDLLQLLREHGTRERVFDAFPDAVLVLDPHGTVIDLNRRAADVLDRSPDERVELHELIEPDVGVAPAAGGAGLRQGPVRLRRRDGSSTRAFARSVVIPGATEPLQLVVLTDLPRDPLGHAFAAAEQRLAAVVASASDAIVSIDAAQRIVLFNESAEQMFGLPAARALGQPLERLIPERYRAAHREHVETFMHTGRTDRRMGALLGTLWGLRVDGSEFPIEATISRVDGTDGPMLTAIVRDVTERRQLEDDRDRLAASEARMTREALSVQDRMARLQAITDAALVHLSLDQLLDELLSRLRELIGADSATVLLLDPRDRVLRVRATSGLARSLEERVEIPLGGGVTGRIAERRRAAIIDDLRRARPIGPFLNRRLRSLVGVPILHQGEVTGVLHVASVQARRFAAEDVALLEVVAARLAPAIENAQLHGAEKRARAAAELDATRLRLVLQVAESIGTTRSVDEMAQGVLERLASALGTAGAAVSLLTEDGSALRMVAAHGYGGVALERWRTIPLDADVPLAACIRRLRPIFLATPEERDAAFPSLRETAPVGRSWAALPLEVDDKALGALALSFGEPRPFEEHDVELLTAIAHQCAQAVDRARRYERERSSAARSDATSRRIGLLQALTARFSGALTPREIASITVSEAAAQLGASAGVFHTLDEEGTLRLQASEGYAGPALEAWERLPADLPTPAGDALRTGDLVETTSPSELVDRSPSPRSSLGSPGPGATVAVPIVVDGRPIGAASLTFEQGRELTEDDRRLLLALGRHAGQALERARLFETERRARREAERSRERIARLQTLALELGDAVTSAQVLTISVRHLLAALGAAATAVTRVRADRVEVAASRGYPAQWAERPIPLDAPTPLTEAIRTRTGVWLDSVEEAAARYPEALEASERIGHHRGAFAAIPMKVGDRVLGAVGVQFAEARTWSEEDKEFLRVIVRQTARAIDEAELREAEADARAELQRVERRYRSLVGSATEASWTVDPAGAFVEPQASWEAYTGQPWDEHRGFGWVDALHPEDRDALLSTWLAARDAGSVFTAEARLWHAATEAHRWVLARAAPVRDADGSIEEWVGTVVDVDDQRRQELERADREAFARTRLEIAGERLAYLAAASSVLASSLDVTRTLQRLVELAVPRLADWCVVDMVADDDSIELVAVAHVDPAKVELAYDIRRRYPPDPNARIGLPAVIRSGRSELMEEIPRELIEQAAARDPELGELIDRLHLRSAMIVPITLGDRTLGAITFVRAESDTRYERDDLVLAEDLALRAAVAVENARLYEAERGARDEETQARARLEVIAEAGAAMASSLDQRTIVDALVRTMALGAADASVAYLLDRHERIAEVVAAHRDPALDPALRRVAASTPESPSELHEVVATVLRTGDRVLEPALPHQSAASEDAPLGRGSRIALPLGARGRTLGVLVMARAAGSEAFDEDDLQMATEVARRGGLMLDNARLYGEREEVAETLQRSLLPPDLPEVPGLDVAAASRPATQELGGDFYDVFEVDLDHWGAVIGDVVGKGAPAAAMMGLARYTLRTAGMSESRPSVLLGTLNDAILRQTRDTMFCTACFARIHRHGPAVRVTLAVGGHPLPLVLRADGAVEPFGRPGTLLGVFEEPTLADRVTDLMPGDALVMYTDGVTDERRGHEEFGEVRLREVLSTLAGNDARAIADRVVQAVETFRTDQPQDDIAILVVRVPA